jgi:hypothetical protein
MAEASFEFRLERMFAEAPAAPDADLFAAMVMGRLDRGWTTRRFLIGGMGVVGGVIGAVQVVGGGTFSNAIAMVGHANQLLTQALASAMPPGLPAADLGLETQVIWVAGALAAVAAGFGLARLFREI